MSTETLVCLSDRRWLAAFAVKRWIDIARQYFCATNCRQSPQSNAKKPREILTGCYPTAPECAELLELVPVDQRPSPVFRFSSDEPRTTHTVCERVVAIGKAAGMVIKPRTKLDGDGKPVTVNQCASAHDLHRSFGLLWSRKEMPTVLRELMRHESIETTMRYYVGQNAESTADTLWERHERETQPASNVAVG